MTQHLQANTASVKAATISSKSSVLQNNKNNSWLIALWALWGLHKHQRGMWMVQVLLQSGINSSSGGTVSTGADAASLHRCSLGDSVSTAGRLKSVYSVRGHINPITTNLVVMFFIEAGAFPSQQHLGLFWTHILTHMHTHTFPLHHTLLTCKYVHAVSHTESHAVEAPVIQTYTTLHKVAERCYSYYLRTPQHLDSWALCLSVILQSVHHLGQHPARLMIEQSKEHGCTASQSVMSCFSIQRWKVLSFTRVFHTLHYIREHAFYCTAFVSKLYLLVTLLIPITHTKWQPGTISICFHVSIIN